MTERVIQEKWVRVAPRVMDTRLDTLREMADYLARKIDISPTGSRRREERQHAAIMWAIAELSGIGEEVRTEKASQVQVKASQLRHASNRAEHAEALNAQLSVTNKALKAEVYRLSRSTVDSGQVRAE